MSLDLLFHYLLLNMFRMLVYPSSGACELLWIYFVCCIALVRCVLVLQWNNKASEIKLVYLYSTIKMMHGPINISFTYLSCLILEQFIFCKYSELIFVALLFLPFINFTCICWFFPFLHKYKNLAIYIYI